METGRLIFSSLGMTIIHSLWQGIIIGTVVFLILGLNRKDNAQLRYWVMFSGLMLILTGFMITFWLVYSSNGPVNLHPSAVFTAYGNQHDVLPGINRTFLLLEPFFPYLAFGWITGFLLLGLRTLGGYVIYKRSLFRGVMKPDYSLAGLFSETMSRMHLRGNIRLFVSTRMISPLVAGVWQPLVIIPAAAISGLSMTQIKDILIHELAHIKRYDHYMVILQALARQILFFHPVVWLLLPEIDRERENCCDDYVLKSNENPVNYIKALAMIQEMNMKNRIPANALTGKSNQLLNRIRRMMNPQIRHSNAFRITAILLFVAMIGMSTMAFVISDMKTEAKKLVAENSKTVCQSDQTVLMNHQDGDKKKMKVVFSNDTIKEMTVNGKTVYKEDMKQYADEIRRMQEELKKSQAELEAANNRLKEAQEELHLAQKNLQGTEIPFDFHFSSPQTMPHQEINLEHMKKLLQDENFQEEMNRAQAEAKRAYGEAWAKQKEYWLQHQDEFRQQMEKAGKEAEKAFESFKLNHQELENLNIPIPPVPPVPPVYPPSHELSFPHMDQDIQVPDPVIPHSEMEPGENWQHKEQTVPEKEDKETPSSLDTQLRELEKE